MRRSRSLPRLTHQGALDVIARFVMLAALSALVLFTIGASHYPGGNHFNRAAVGHDFWRNALCDVARSTAVGGLPNAIGASFARAAMAIMAFGIGGLYWVLPERFPSSPGIATSVRSLGSITVPATLGVVLLPADRFSALHGVAIMIAGFPALGAGLLALVGLLRERAGLRAVTVLALATFVVAAVDFGIYADEVIRGGSSRLAVPVLERVAALLLVAWMIAASLRSRARVEGSSQRMLVSGRVSGVDDLADYDAPHDECSHASRASLPHEHLDRRLQQR